MCSKENIPLILVTFRLFLLYLVWRESRKITLPLYWLRDEVLAFVVFAGIGCLFYSSFGAHPEVLLTSVPSAIEHWLNMHNQQRIGGQPYYYLLLFVLYELPILIFTIACVVLYLRNQGTKQPVQTGKKFSLVGLFRRPEPPGRVHQVCLGYLLLDDHSLSYLCMHAYTSERKYHGSRCISWYR